MSKIDNARKMQIEILKKSRKGTAPNAIIRWQMATALCLLGFGGYNLSVMFTNDEEMAKLNLHYRGKTGTTDVLSFSQTEGDVVIPGSLILGDIVISVQRAEKQAEENGLKTEEEILRLLIHGVCHLAGYDHEISSSSARKMQTKEKNILDSLSKVSVE